jgi:acetolactate synthase-1/2/3 large subunit
VARAVADAVAAAGARFAFTVPGESFLPLLDALLGAGIRPVATRHEGAAAFMAEAATQLSGRPQLLLATRTVGAANAAIGIHTARQDSTPLVALVGQVRRRDRGREAFQESELAEGIGSLAKWAAEPSSPSEAVRLTGEGLRAILHGRPGPMLLAIPEDLLDAPADASVPVPAFGTQGPAADRSAVRHVLRALAASERGLILAGGGILRARASKRLVALSEALAVPVMAAWRRPDVFPNDHPHYLGMTGWWSAPTVRQRLLDTDVLLVIGSRLSEVATFGYQAPGPGTRWMHVDVEPRPPRSGLPVPAMSIAADASRFLDAAWSDLRAAALDAEMRSEREARIAHDRAAYLEASAVDAGPWDGPGVHPGRVITELASQLPANGILTTDAGNFGGWAARGYRFRRPGTFLGPTSGAMGYGLPAAIAASLVHPDRPVVALCGDGGFAMTMAELETAVREGARLVAIVFDNGHYGTIRMHQEREGRAVTATDLGPIDFAAVARAAGALGFSVDDDAQVGPAIAEALASGRPAVVHLQVDRSWVSVDHRP